MGRFYDNTAGATGIDNTYNEIIAKVDSRGSSVIIKGKGTSSDLYAVPCTTPYYDSGNMAFAGSAVCTAILNWINEGAYND